MRKTVSSRFVFYQSKEQKDKAPTSAADQNPLKTSSKKTNEIQENQQHHLLLRPIDRNKNKNQEEEKSSDQRQRPRIPLRKLGDRYTRRRTHAQLPREDSRPIDNATTTPPPAIVTVSPVMATATPPPAIATVSPVMATTTPTVTTVTTTPAIETVQQFQQRQQHQTVIPPH